MAERSDECGKCGAKRAGAIGSVASAPIEPSAGVIALPRQSVGLTIVLSLITGGIYVPVWFLRRRDAINRLAAPAKLSIGPFVYSTVALSICLVLSAVQGGLQGSGSGDAATLVALLARILQLTAGITILVQSFKTRGIFEAHLRAAGYPTPSLSALGTFFFQVWYLQHVVNTRTHQAATALAA